MRWINSSTPKTSGSESAAINGEPSSNAPITMGDDVEQERTGSADHRNAKCLIAEAELSAFLIQINVISRC
jgi:hypothetical protein